MELIECILTIEISCSHVIISKIATDDTSYCDASAKESLGCKGKQQNKKVFMRCDRVRQDLGQAGADFFCFQPRISQYFESRFCLFLFSLLLTFFFIVSVRPRPLREKNKRWLMAPHWYATFELKFKYLPAVTDGLHRLFSFWNRCVAILIFSMLKCCRFQSFKC